MYTKFTYLMLLLPSFGALALLGAQPKNAPNSCPPISPETTNRLTHFVQEKAKQSVSPKMEIYGVETDCYYRLGFIGADTQHPFRVSLLLTPDQTRLLANAFDTRVDPEATDRAQAAQIQEELSRGGKTLIGTDNAPVKIVVFSDFQCPYCAGFWKTLQKTLSQEDQNKLFVSYRSLPLDNIHHWARKAAVISDCAYQQRREYYQGLAQEFFGRQHEITSDLFVETVARTYLKSQPSFNDTRFETCIASGEGATDVKTDEALGLRIGINSVPAVFVNGMRIMPSEQKLRDAIETAEAASAQAK